MNALPPQPNVRRTRLRNLSIVMGAFLLGGWVLPNIHITWREPASEAQEVGLDLRQAAAQPLGPDETYAHAARAAYKAVVNIDTTQRVQVHFFDDSIFGNQPRYSNRSMEGSGVIISKTGYILTNEHVVGRVNDASRTIKITLTDGRQFNGRVVGADYIADVALVKIDNSGGKDLPVAQLGTSQGLEPGQMCIAIGNPLTLRFTVTHGVVSALKRPVATPDGRIYPDLIQHDAGINPGNSGGPLVNMLGQVIGINTLVNEQAEGIGFAIPIDTALRVADELKRYGHLKRPWLGIAVISNSQELAQLHDLPSIAGAVIDGVYPNSPAETAGLKTGDIITRVNGTKVNGEESFKSVQSKLTMGQQAELEVHRGNKYANVKVMVGEKPSSDPQE